MRFLSKIRERQFAKKWGGAYNLSRAVLAGVLAAGCLMPGFAEAATEPPKLLHSSDVVCTKVENIATIENDIESDIYTRVICWHPGYGEKDVKDCTINVDNRIIGPTIMIYGGYTTSTSGEANGNIVSISGSTIKGQVLGGYSESGDADDNSVSIIDSNFNGSVAGGSAYGIAYKNSVDISGGEFNGSVAGGYSASGTAKENSVSISDSTFNGDVDVYGGYSDSGAAAFSSGDTGSDGTVTDNNVTGNKVEISGNTTFTSTSNIFGGYTSGNVAVTGNTVTIEDTTFKKVTISGNTTSESTFNIYGGYIDGDGTVTGNTVTIKGTTFKNKATIYGGYTRTGGTVTGNTVTISGNTTFESSSEIYGGYACDANENSVIISGGNITGLVSGGHGINANKNSVIISGSNITGYVYGGSASNFGTANNNKVILVGEHATYPLSAEQTINGGKIEITGAVFGGSGTSNRSGNQLHVYGSNTTVGNIVNFDNLYFYINENMPSDKVMLTITGNNITDISESKVEVTFDGAPPAKDDLKTITLIQKTDEGEESIIKAPSKNNITVNCGPALTGSVDLENYGKDLVLTLKNFTVNENGKSLVETRAAAAFVVNNMSDFMLGQGMEQAKAAAGGVTPIDAGTMAPFAAVGGSNMRYTTGSYVDVNGWNGAVGFAKQADKLLFGVAVEHGRGNYDSYLDNGVHASGDIKSTGGVIFGEYKLDNGVHYDAALRAGRVKSDYNSTATSYDESSTYYGFSLGDGKELTVSDKATLDVYGRYYFSHTNGSDVSIATNQEIDFDAVNSHRLRIGGRYTTTLTEKSKAYAGLAWQYEFGGDAKAAINGYSAPTPSLQGHSAIVEAGYKLNAGKNLTLDFNLNGAMGKQRGIGGGIGAQWLF